NDGYFEARSLGYITKPGNAVLEWLRLPGDVIMIVGGVLPFVWIAWTALRNFRSGSIVEELPQHPLYSESGTETQAESKADSGAKD
ncbi:MAG: nitric-oxide reductase large subunit, partial [Mycobacterium sp.]